MANTVVITGRLTKDPELRQTPAGVSAVTICIACDRYAGKDRGNGGKGSLSTPASGYGTGPSGGSYRYAGCCRPQRRLCGL